MHSPTICHRQVAKTLAKVPASDDVQIVHYIDDDMIQGNEEERVQQQLEKVMDTLEEDGWKTNPAKIQGPSSNVKFLGVLWNNGKQEILPKARQKILDFAAPRNKKEAQKFIGLFGFWRAHIPHLSRLLAPL